jgi:hypothetical protein
MIKPVLLTPVFPPLTPRGSSLGLGAANEDGGASMLCTSTEPVSLDEGFEAAAPPLPPPLLLLLLLLLALLPGYGPCDPDPTRGSVNTSAPLLAFLAATALSAATSSSRVSWMTLPLHVHLNHVGCTCALT